MLRTRWVTVASLALVAGGLLSIDPTRAAEATTSGANADDVAADKAALPSEPVDVRLPDFYGRQRSLAEFADRKVVVLAFLGTDCPLVKLYVPRLVALAAEFESQGVAFIGVNSNRQDSLTKIGQIARQQQITFPILKDRDHALADRLGATRTPEVFVLDERRVVRYQGRIDDQYGVGVARREARSNELADAIRAVLAGEPVAVARTEAPGCLIGRAPRVAPHGEITYANQIARILNDRCVTCHRTGEVGPFALTSYEEVAGWAEMIREVVDQRRMPPWFADPAHGEFENDSRLSDEELATIRTWVANGAPAGDLSDLPAPPEFAAGWRIPQPDVVFYMSDEPFVVRAEGTEEYQTFEIDPGFTEDKWVQAAEARPGNRSVVHHHVAYFVEPGGNAQISQVKNQIAGYAPGTPPFLFAPGTALRIPAGVKIRFQMHYTPVGTEQPDRSSLGLVFADPQTVRNEVRNEIVGNIGLRIPPGEADYRLQAKKKFRRDTLLLNLAPHMHVRGKAFRFELELADGTREVLLDVPRYDFNWQLRYDLVEPRLIPAGSRLHCYAAWDNSADNPANPDPTKLVTFGEQTWDEMMFGVYQTIEPREPPTQ
ncbi:MAG: redoxin domain-containing protein [Pirellulales bacterium]